MRERPTLLLLLLFLVSIQPHALAVIRYAPGMGQAPYEEVVYVDAPPFEVDDTQLHITFMDIGLGDAILLESGGQRMLVDFGTAGRSVRATEHLRAMGVEHIDYMFNTHAHDDHLGGLHRLISHDWSVGQFLSHHPEDCRIPEHRALRGLLDEKGIPLVPVGVSDTMQLGSSTLRLFRLERNEISKAFNIASTLLHITHGERSMLLTADISISGEKALVAQFPELLSADIVKAPHHGYSKMHPDFLDAVDPQLVIITNQRGSVPEAERQLMHRRLPRYYLGGGNIHLSTDGQVWYVHRDEQTRWSDM